MKTSTITTTTGILVGDGTGWLLRPLGWYLGVPHRGRRPVTLRRYATGPNQHRWQRFVGRREWSTTVAVSDNGFTEQLAPGVRLAFDRRHHTDADLIAIRVGPITIRPRHLAIALRSEQSAAVVVTVRLGRHRCRYRTELAMPTVGQVWQ